MIGSGVRRLRDQRGFALPEMLSSIAVLGILFAVFAGVMSTTITHSTREETSALLQAESRAAMERFASELRQAYSGDGTWPIQNVIPATNTILFLSPDRREPFHLRQIEWRLSGGSLQRRSITSTDTDGHPWVWPGAITSAPWTTEVRSVQNTTVFQFLDGAEPAAPTTVAASVRRVVVTIVIATTGHGSRTYTYTTSVTPRVSHT